MSVKSSSVSGSILDHLVTIKNEMIDRKLALEGHFEDEIKRLAGVKDAIEEKLGMVKLVEDAKAIKEDAETYADGIRKSAESTFAQAKQALESANNKMDAALAKEASLQEREATAAHIKQVYEAKEEELMTHVSQAEAALVTREAALSAGQAQLSADVQALETKKNAVLGQLEAASKLAKGITA